MAYRMVHPTTADQICPARKLALLALVEVEKKDAYVNLSLRELMSRSGSHRRKGNDNSAGDGSRENATLP
jgi:hypothetical protein